MCSKPEVILLKKGEATYCIDINCGIVGSPINPDADYWFFSTYLLSLVSASFGMCRFLKSGPMTLVSRTSYGFSFILSMFTLAVGMVSKGVILHALIFNLKNPAEISINTLVWIGCNLLPSLVYVSAILLSQDVHSLILRGILLQVLNCHFSYPGR